MDPGTNWIIGVLGSVNFCTLCVLIYKIGNFTGVQSTQIAQLQAQHRDLQSRVEIVSARTHAFASTALVLNLMKDQVERLEKIVDNFRS